VFGRLNKAERLFAYGQRLARQERFEEAVSAYERALEARPDASGIFLHRALALSELDRPDEAVTSMQQAMARQPANPVLPMFLGQILFDHGDYAAARTWCRRVLELNPSNAHAHALVALTELRQGHITAGCQRLAASVPLPTSEPMAALVSALGMRIPSLVHETNAMLQSRLLLIVETYLLEHPEWGRSLAEQLRGREERGLGYTLMYAIDLVVTRGVMTLRRLATWPLTLGRPSQRAMRWKRLAADEAYYLGRLDTAQAHYGQLPADLVDSPAVQERLYDICYERGDFRAALRHLQRTEVASSRDGSLPSWYSRQLGELLYLNGRYARAATALSQAIERGDREYRNFYYLALCALRRGEAAPARRLFAHAVQQLHPDIVPLRLEEMLRVHYALTSEDGKQ
jgi:tetratricopeptide (TPR) repeat protein